jgi:predicted nucleotidyltransferase
LMPRDPFIDEEMWRRIDGELDTIERDHRVRILLAVESGSRAWRFPSADSDYDVRFVYVRALEDYLSIQPPPDDIQLPIEGALDISGWDLRKALRLLVRSNAVLLEWLASPVRYRDAEDVPARLRALARATCFLSALIYHYDRMARRSFDQIVSSSIPIPLKTYCYALRPALALGWMRRHCEPPPMALPELLRGSSVDDALKQTIDELVDCKATATERNTTARVPELEAFIANILTEKVERFTLPDRTAVRSQANALIASLVRGSP